MGTGNKETQMTGQQEYRALIQRWMAGDHTPKLRDKMRPYAIKYAAEREAKVRRLAEQCS